MKFVGRFSGVVAYSDDTHDSFAVHRDERGNLSVNSGVNSTPNSSNQAINEAQVDHNWLEEMLALVSGTLALAPLGPVGKTVTDATLHFSGRVSRDDNTWEDFAVQYEIKAGGAHVLTGSGSGNGEVSAYDEFLAETLDPWFGELVGEPQVTAP